MKETFERKEVQQGLLTTTANEQRHALNERNQDTKEDIIRGVINNGITPFADPPHAGPLKPRNSGGAAPLCTPF